MSIGCLGITGPHVVFIGRESTQSNGTDLVKGLDLIFALLVLLEVAVCLPLATAVFDFDRRGQRPGASIWRRRRRRRR